MEHKNESIFSLSASSLIGDSVYDLTNSKLGYIEDIMLNITSGDIHYFVLALERHDQPIEFYAIPWNETQIDTKNKCIRIPTTKERIDTIPGLTDTWPEAYSDMWKDELMKFYECILISTSTTT